MNGKRALGCPKTWSPSNWAIALVVGVELAGACLGSEPTDGSPKIVRVFPASNPQNALSIMITIEGEPGDSARVIYWADGQSQNATPFQRMTGHHIRIATLGLRAATTYKHVVEVWGHGGTVTSDTFQFPTGTPPPLVGRIHMTLSGTPSEGYTIISPLALSADTAVIVAIDSTGEVCWYRLFAEGTPSVLGQQMPNGSFVMFLGRTQGWQPTYGRFVEFTPAGEVLRQYEAVSPFYTDNHDILLSPSDTGVNDVSMFGYELRPMDLTSLGGPSNALVAGHVIVRQTPSGQLKFLWNAWDHYGISDWIEPTGVNPPLDFDHPNSLVFDSAGDYVVSFRNMGAIATISSNTGETVWQLGGRRNQFTLTNDPLGGFSAQHSVSVLRNGRLLLYDNGLSHNPPESRAVEYELDLGAKTATMTWEFRHTPPVFTPAVGSVQRYSNGNTLLGFGFVGIVTEVNYAGNVVWEGQLMFGPALKGVFYRAQQVKSLYKHVVP